jgi:hypothetical protein
MIYQYLSVEYRGELLLLGYPIKSHVHIRLLKLHMGQGELRGLRSKRLTEMENSLNSFPTIPHTQFGL